MPFSSSIASKIFGLAVVLVSLMVALVAFLLWQVSALNHDLHTIAQKYYPLEQCLVDLNESGLRRRLAFERWNAARSANPPRTEAIAEAQANYAKFTPAIQSNIEAARILLTAAARTGSEPVEFQQIRSALEEMESIYAILGKRQLEVLNQRPQGRDGQTDNLMAMMDDLQKVLQDRRSQAQKWIAGLVSTNLHLAEKRHQRIVWTTTAATAASVLLALILAALITQRLVQPVRSLMTGIRTVEKGDFSIELPVQSRDEVGALTTAFNYFINELRMKEEMRTAFGKYIDPRILERVLLRPGSAESVGGKQEMTVSFADLAGFTAIGEFLTPAGVVKLLNSHFSLQADAIQRHHGVIDKFIGDAVMAFWGEPFTREGEHAALACRAALDQVRALATLESMLPEITGLRKNLPHLAQRIGLSTGEMVAGSIGSENARSYTVIGDTVNLASRLEQANRFYGTRILICETTQRRAGENFVTREIDRIVAKGKTESTRIFELLGSLEDSPAEGPALAESFSAALAAYRGQDWTSAESGFRKCLQIRPDDGPSRLFLERVEAFRRTPPADGWNGEWVLDSK